MAGECARRLGIDSLFLRLLSATFIAHAVGCTMWLYLVPTTPDYWLSLLTLVPAERLVFASSATLTALLLGVIKKHIQLALTKKQSI